MLYRYAYDAELAFLATMAFDRESCEDMAGIHADMLFNDLVPEEDPEQIHVLLDHREQLCN